MNCRRNFGGGIEIASNVRNFKDIVKSETRACESGEKIIYQRKEFTANLNELKRKTSNEEIKKRPKLPYYVLKFQRLFLFVVFCYTQMSAKLTVRCGNIFI